MKFLNSFNLLQKLLCFDNRLCRLSSTFKNDQMQLSGPIILKTTELNSKYLSNSLGKPENDEKLEIMLNDINTALAKNLRCPQCINLEQLQLLYSLNTRSQRKKYLTYLFKKELYRKSDQLKKEEKSKSAKIYDTKGFGCDFSKYGLGNKSLLFSVRRKSINQFYYRRLAISVLFGSKIVIDLDYDKYMVERERASCASQLKHIYTENRLNQSPFDLYFCNVKSNSKCIKYFERDIPNINETCISFCEESYLDIFPKESLVYLSPHADESLKSFDHNAVYIIGGFVDTVKRDKVSLDKASVEGIKSYSLPLDEYIQWKAGSKSLTINQVFDIMLALKNTGNWKKAFEKIPIRKIKMISSEGEEEEVPQIVSLNVS